MANDSVLNVYRYEDPARQRGFDRSPEQRFDRIAFAVRTLRLLGRTGMRVVVFQSSSFHLEQGRDLCRGPEARWALLGIPSDASAQSIVLELGRLFGVSNEPYVLEALLGVAQVTERAN